MDYPKSVPGVGLVDGKFVDENPATGQVGSLIPAPWGNAVTDELLSVLTEAGIQPNEANVGQLLQGLKIIFATLVSPAFKGAPTAPTPPVADRSTRIATTETVAAAVGAIDVSGKVNRAGDGMGPLSVAASAEGADYGRYALEVRESNRWTDSKGRDIKYAPKIIFHWGNVTVMQMRMTAAGVFEMVDGTGAAYAAFQAGNINATQAMTVGGSAVWHAGNFNPATKANAVGFNMAWSGVGGQPTWILGGELPGDIKVYNPLSWRVDYANNAGSAAKWGMFPLRYAENPGRNPYYLVGIEAGSGEMSIYNMTGLSVATAANATQATYATQLTGQGLQHTGIGGYILNKNHTSPEFGGAWEIRGYAYDFGSGGDGGIGTRISLWQRVG